MEFLVGAFNQSSIYLLRFEPQPLSNNNNDANSNDPASSSTSASLRIIHDYPALAPASWLSLSPDKKYLYTTAWIEQPAIAAYKIKSHGRKLDFLNARRVSARPGYVTCNATHVFSCGGPSGEVFTREADGKLGEMVQALDFVTGQGANASAARGEVAHGDFGGLRHGAHSFDLSPDGRFAYVADIGRNCVWTFEVGHSRRGSREPPLLLREKKVAPREGDGPRHTWPHPNGRILYSLQEHSSMVDVFVVKAVSGDETNKAGVLEHRAGVKIIPTGKDPKLYWADEVRLSTGPDPTKPRHLFASTRGLKPETRGFVAAFRLDQDGHVESENAVDIWQTPTSGGIANAIEPAPWNVTHGEMEYLAMTDSEEGWVFLLSFDGEKIREVARQHLGRTEEGHVIGAATAVWLQSS